MESQTGQSLLHITSGDCAGSILAQSGIAGEVFVWHDILYDGPRASGWPDDAALQARSAWLEQETGGGLRKEFVLETLRRQYRRLAEVGRSRLLLWFDACLFDQSMLVHILACLYHLDRADAELICVDAFPGIEPFNGLGQFRPEQMASLYGRQKPVTKDQFRFAAEADEAFARRDPALLARLAACQDAPLPCIPAAAARCLLEQPDPSTGLGRLQQLALDAVRSGCEKPAAILCAVAAADIVPRFWGDTTLWARINALADREPPLLRIEGPGPRLPQWESELDLEEFKIEPAGKPPERA